MEKADSAPSVKPLDGSAAAQPSRDLVQFVKFGLVGVLNTAVDFTVYTLLYWAGIPYLLAQCVSFAAGTANSYVLNRMWTFQARGQQGAAGQLGRHILWNVIVLLLSLGLLYLFSDGLGMHPMPAKVVVTIIATVVNFVGSKLWVFRKG